MLREKRLRKLHEITTGSSKVDVIRNGKTLRMSVYDVLVGDVVLVTTGQILELDGVVLESRRILIDSSCMTGDPKLIQSVPFELNSRSSNCFLFSGTKVVGGAGKMMVLTVGNNTYENLLKPLLQQDDDITPLQEK